MSDEKPATHEAAAEAPHTRAKKSSGYVGAATRRVQYADQTLDIEQGEPVDVPDGLADSWVEMGWITAE